jgi:hypothetical protein
LREFHLEATFGGARAPGKDVEDQLRAIDDFNASRAFQIALLGGGEFVVDDQHARMERVRQFLQLLHLSVSEQRSGVDLGTDLKYFGGNLRPGAGGQFGEFAKGFGRGAGRCTSAPFKARQDCFLGILLK